MRGYSLSHLPDPVLLRDLAALVAQDRATTAALLAHLAEVDARRLYLPAGFPSMFLYCVQQLGFSEEATFKRIRAARTARRFPAIFNALADGRLHVSAVVMLTPYVTPENADELLAAAAQRSKVEIEQLLAERFPRPELPARVETLSPPLPSGQLAPGPVDAHGSGQLQLAPGPVESPPPRSKLAPLAPERYGLQLTIGQGTYEKLGYAQALLGHAIPSGDLAAVLDRALDALIGQLERGKFAATPPASPQSATRLRGPAAHPRGGQAHGLAAGWRPVHLRRRQRAALPGPHPAGVRPPRPGGARRPGLGGAPASYL